MTSQSIPRRLASASLLSLILPLWVLGAVAAAPLWAEGGDTWTLDILGQSDSHAELRPCT
jgi:hypothetical protein